MVIKVPGLDELGPEDLASTIIEYRYQNKVIFDFTGGPILLDDWITRLVQLVYHVSLVPDEGRYPRFRIVFANASLAPGIGLPDWSGHLLESSESLRRLAPAVAGPGTALLIHAGINDRLTAWRIVDFENFCGVPNTSNRLADRAILPNGVLVLRCDAPGDVRAMLHPSPVFHLRGGTIRTLNSYYDAVEPFQALAVTLSAELHASVKNDKRIEHYVPNPGVFAQDFADLWAATLSTAVEGRHGGAFVIVPSRDCPHVEVKYKADGGLFATFEEKLRHCLEFTDSSGPRHLAIFKQYWQSQQNHLLRVARMIGQLAATDGCVLLDRHLNLQGFGAKISWPKDDAGFLPLTDVANGKEVPGEQIEQRMGMRHRSACQLARIVRGAIIFVVSQDGDLTAFYNHNSSAYWHTGLGAWPSVSELL